ncbi:hypothetical protein B0H13DRAFT_2530882 [Mycena leptocephala]|nr:hypothetical protein B0H13DRAFT_2530882 [Mycena leptocephala]
MLDAPACFVSASDSEMRDDCISPAQHPSRAAASGRSMAMSDAQDSPVDIEWIAIEFADATVSVPMILRRGSRRSSTGLRTRRVTIFRSCQQLRATPGLSPTSGGATSEEGVKLDSVLDVEVAQMTVDKTPGFLFLRPWATHDPMATPTQSSNFRAREVWPDPLRCHLSMPSVYVAKAIAAAGLIIAGSTRKHFLLARPHVAAYPGGHP